MKFTLTIELGNDAMQTYSDIRDALHRTAAYMEEYRGEDEPVEHGDGAMIRDANRNTVGKWEVTE